MLNNLRIHHLKNEIDFESDWDADDETGFFETIRNLLLLLTSPLI